MNTRRSLVQFGYRRSADQDRAHAHHPVIIVGAGPVGLSLALDLAQRGQPVVILDDADRIGEGSRALCFAKRTLEIFDRLGVADRMLDKGVQWQKGRVFRADSELYSFDLLPEGGHKLPAFINLQQYYVEQFLVEAVSDLSSIDLRWRNRVVGVAHVADGVQVTIDTPDGPYQVAADWLIACDGARSPLRSMLSLDFAGEVFEDRFLIADVRMAADFPTERWFWFDPPFHPGQSALLHKQPDGIWRIDLQLGREADIEREKDPELVTARVARMLGHRDFTLEWVSIYRFQCRRLERFVHDRVIFAGDSAHQVSPFGARGANSGIQDADNLGWKLARILDGTAPATLLDSYDRERSEAADENILNSTRSTDFIAPHSAAERRLRDAVLDLAPHAGFAQRMVNSGRLSLPTAYSGSQLSTADSDAWHGGVPPGAPLVDCPLRTRRGDGVFLHDVYDRQRFTVVAMQNGGSLNPPAGAALVSIGPEGAFDDETGLFARRYAATPGSAYLLRPDGHVAARFKSANSELLEVALRRAGGGRA